MAIRCYEKGIELDDEECLFLLGDMYDSGKHIDKDSGKAMEYICKAALKGECRAQCRLGDYNLYDEGNDPDMALYWYRLAAGNGSVMAMKELARIYEQGIIVTQSINRALFWYNKAYLNKDEIAKNDLDRLAACFNPFEEESEEDLNEKSKRLATENSDPVECYNLGVRYLEGKDGLEKDLLKSILWFELGSDLGNTRCLDNLGYMYYYGDGADTDYEKAEGYFRKAAEQGSPYSQMMLGYMYHNGNYLKIDQEQRDKWLRRAASQGYKDQIEELFCATGGEDAYLNL